MKARQRRRDRADYQPTPDPFKTTPATAQSVTTIVERDRYADCGQAMRRVVLRAHADNTLTTVDLRVLNAVLVLTVSWSKLEDETTRREIAGLAYGHVRDKDNGWMAVKSWQRKRAEESLRRLADRDYIDIESHGRGPHARVWVSLKTPHPRVIDGAEKDPSDSSAMTPQFARNDPSVSPTMTPRSRAHREVTEEVTENKPSSSHARACAPAREQCPPPLLFAQVVQLIFERRGKIAESHTKRNPAAWRAETRRRITDEIAEAFDFIVAANPDMTDAGEVAELIELPAADPGRKRGRCGVCGEHNPKNCGDDCPIPLPAKGGF